MEPSNTWEVPRENWATFLTQVEALERDRPVDLELIGSEMGDQPLAEGVQLRAIGVTSRGVSDETIELDLGVDGSLDHRILHPTHLYAAQSASGLLEYLDIEDESHSKTLVRFTEPILLPMGSTAVPKADREVLVRDYMTSPAHLLFSGSSLTQAFELMQAHGIRHLPVVDFDTRLLGILSDRNLDLAKRERGISPDDVTVDEMTRSPFAVTSTTRMDEAAAVLAERKYGCAVVVEDERVVGVLTTTDALRALVQLRGSGERLR